MKKANQSWVIIYFPPIGQCLNYNRVVEIPKQVTLIVRMRHLFRKKHWQIDHYALIFLRFFSCNFMFCSDYSALHGVNPNKKMGICIILMCSIIISFRRVHKSVLKYWFTREDHLVHAG